MTTQSHNSLQFITSPPVPLTNKNFISNYQWPTTSHQTNTSQELKLLSYPQSTSRDTVKSIPPPPSSRLNPHALSFIPKHQVIHIAAYPPDSRSPPSNHIQNLQNFKELQKPTPTPQPSSKKKPYTHPPNQSATPLLP
jgi:hypothetical protein